MNSASRAQFQRKQWGRETAGLISELARTLEMSASYSQATDLGTQGRQSPAYLGPDHLKRSCHCLGSWLPSLGKGRHPGSTLTWRRKESYENKSCLGSNKVCIPVSGFKRTQAAPHTASFLFHTGVILTVLWIFHAGVILRVQSVPWSNWELAIPPSPHSLQTLWRKLYFCPLSLPMASLASAQPVCPSHFWPIIPDFPSFSWFLIMDAAGTRASEQPFLLCQRSHCLSML